MAFSTQFSRKRTAFRQAQRELPPSLRQHPLLKVIALVASVLLYYYVQAERNPTVTRAIIANVVRENVPPDVEVETDQQQVMVSVTGPRPILDLLKDGSLRAIADLSKVRTDELGTQVVHTRLVSGLSHNLEDQLGYEPLSPSLKVQVYPPQTRQLQVSARYPKEPPAGFEYGKPDVRPARVKITGRADRVNRVETLIVNAAPAEAGARIDGDFAVLARDRNGSPVEGVTLVPDTVHVTVPLNEEPPQKIVTISPIIVEYPTPPYTLVDYTVTPKQVKVIGRQERLGQIYTLHTEDISLRDVVESQEIEVNLLDRPDVKVRGLDDAPISRVKVRVTIRKSSTTPNTPSPSGDGAQTAPPKDTRPQEPNGGG